MPPVPRPRPRQLLLAALLAAPLLLAACGPTPSGPDATVADAVEQTLGESFAFTLRVDADDDGRALLHDEDPQLAALLDTLEVRGSLDWPAVSFTVEALGVEVVELRRVDGTRYLRLDPDALALLTDGEVDADELRRDLAEAPEPLREAGEALLTGGWLALEGEVDELAAEGALPLFGPFAPLGVGDPEEAKDAFRRHVAADVAEFVDRFAVVTETGDGVYDVAVQLRVLAEALVEMAGELAGPLDWVDDDDLHPDLDEVPEELRGLTVSVAERRVQRAAVDVLEARRSLGKEVGEGAIRMVAELSEHGSAPAIEAPDGATVVDLADLLEEWWGAPHAGGS